MKQATGKILSKTCLLMGLASLSGTPVEAETVYKCVVGDKVNFTSAPAEGQNCRPVELKVVQPNPEEVQRELEKKQLRKEADEKEEAKARAENRQRENAPANRRARSAEEALRLLRESPPMTGYGRSRSGSGSNPQLGGAMSKRYLLQAPQQPPEIVIQNPPLPK